MMTVKELRKASGMSMKRFAEYFGIPYRTVQNWEAGVNKCPEYLLKLMKYNLENEGLISKEPPKGYILIKKDELLAAEDPLRLINERIRADMERGGEDATK